MARAETEDGSTFHSINTSNEDGPLKALASLECLWPSHNCHGWLVPLIAC